MNNLSTNKREPRIDALKGVLILLVVLGHCIGHDTSSRINMVSYDYIYLFHMPLFVFMSGYFTRLGGKFWNRVLNFVCIFLFWHVVKSLYLGRTFFEMIVRPAPMMWYLFSLVIWCVVLWLSQKISKKITPIILIATSVAIALVAGFIPQIETSFALSRTLVFAPFFFLGVSMQKVNFMDVCYNIPCWMAWVVLIIVFIVLYILNIDISIIVRGASPYPDGYLLYGFVGRVVYYIAAIIMSIALIRVVQPNKIMSTVGLDTMKYYIFHGVVLMVLYNMPIPWSFGFAVFYWVVLSVIIFFFNKWKVTDYILNPIGKAIDVIRNKKQ